MLDVMSEVSQQIALAPYAPRLDTHDEAIDADGVIRTASLAALAALEQAGVARVASDVQAGVEAEGIAFHSLQGDQAFVVDPVPRVIEAAEWAVLEAGLIQRTQALDAFVDDVYGPRAAVREGVVPDRVVASADHLDPDAPGLRPPGGVWIGVAGLDLIRDAGGTMRVLEDNVRTPSGLAYAMAARSALQAQFDVPEGDRPRPLDGIPEMLLATLRDAAPPEAGDSPRLAVLSDGPHNSAWWEHRVLAERMGVPLVTPQDVEVRGGRLRRRRAPRETFDAVYRRTDDASSRGPIGTLLRDAVAAGTLGLVNGFGTGVADDKLVHAYVEDLIRFYLRQEPVLPSVRSFDLLRPDHREEALDRLGDLVVKPRNGAGGEGVVICPQQDETTLEALRRTVAERPDHYIAQELMMLSTHPTAVDGVLVPRHVDLRPFVLLRAGRAGSVVPGGLTRVALEEGSLIVNSSRNGGAKDTWVLG